MGFFEDTAVKAKDVFDSAVKKTGEAFSVQKTKLNIASITSQISKEYETLGRLYHDSVKNKADNAVTINAVIGEIEEKQAQIAKLEEEIAAAKNMAVCPACGAKNLNGSQFCSKCGKKLG